VGGGVGEELGGGGGGGNSRHSSKSETGQQGQLSSGVLVSFATRL
jgi:hypothetical protein